MRSEEQSLGVVCENHEQESAPEGVSPGGSAMLLSPMSRMTLETKKSEEIVATPSPTTPVRLHSVQTPSPPHVSFTTAAASTTTATSSQNVSERNHKVKKTSVAGTPDYLAPELLLGK